MKLLIITQKADASDPILGFFHRWIWAFASCTEHLTVAAQYVGQVSLPAHVTVHSLGKEHGRPVWRQILTFWWLIWHERSRYDCVFVHMTPVWVILGWPVWFLLRKRVYLWYEIRRGSWRLSLALLLVRKVFSATVQGLPRTHHKQVVTGHGIDTEVFRPLSSSSSFVQTSISPAPLPPALRLRSESSKEERGEPPQQSYNHKHTHSPSPLERGLGGEVGHQQHLIVAVGRITRSKRYDVILGAFAELPSSARLQIAGGMITQADEREWEALQSLIASLSLTGRVSVEWADPLHMPALLRRADLMLHAAVGGLDKAVLEAMASGCPVVSSSAAAQEVLPESCRATNENMASVAQKILTLSQPERTALGEELRKRVVDQHSLAKLIERLVREME